MCQGDTVTGALPAMPFAQLLLLGVALLAAAAGARPQPMSPAASLYADADPTLFSAKGISNSSREPGGSEFQTHARTYTLSLPLSHSPSL